MRNTPKMIAKWSSVNEIELDKRSDFSQLYLSFLSKSPPKLERIRFWWIIPYCSIIGAFLKRMDCGIPSLKKWKKNHHYAKISRILLAPANKWTNKNTHSFISSLVLLISNNFHWISLNLMFSMFSFNPAAFNGLTHTSWFEKAIRQQTVKKNRF